jgi:hypothetical protein
MKILFKVGRTNYLIDKQKDSYVLKRKSKLTKRWKILLKDTDYQSLLASTVKKITKAKQRKERGRRTKK